MWKRVAVVVLAVWVLSSGSAWAATRPNQVNHAIVGAGLFFFGGLAIRREWARYATLALGVWLFAFTVFLTRASPVLFWSDAMVALAVFVLSLVGGKRRRVVGGPYQSISP